MTPFLGAGAGQAIEDAYVLGAMLAHPLTTRKTVAQALEVYEEICLPRGNSVQQGSKRNGLLHQLNDKRFSWMARDESDDDIVRGKAKAQDENGKDLTHDVGRMWEAGHAVVMNWKWAWTTEAEDDLKRAFRVLEEKIEGLSL